MKVENGEITNQLRRLRFNTGEMTQENLALMAGVTRQTIIAIENGKYSPSLELAFRLANAFKVPLEEVFQWRPKSTDKRSDPKSTTKTKN